MDSSQNFDRQVFADRVIALRDFNSSYHLELKKEKKMRRLTCCVALIMVLLVSIGLTSCGDGGKWADDGDDTPTPQTYVVIYDANGADSGDVPEDAASYAEGDTVTVSGNPGGLEKFYVTLSGWNTNADGTGIAYEAGDTFAMGDEDLTLYAMWQRPDALDPVVHYTFKNLAVGGADIPPGTQVVDHGRAQAHAVTVGTMSSCMDESNGPDEGIQNRGADEYVQIPVESLERINPYITDEITISFWAKARDPHSSYPDQGATQFCNLFGSADQQIIWNMNNSGGGTYDLSVKLGEDNVSDANGDDFTGASNWRHYAITYSDHTTKGYVDGVQRWLRYDATGPVFDFAQVSRLLEHPDDQNDYVTGAMSDFRIYNVALTAQRVQELADKLALNLPLDAAHSVGTAVQMEPNTYTYDAMLLGQSPAALASIDNRFALSQYAESDGATYFNGTSDYVVFENEERLNSDMFAIGLWVNPQAPDAGGAVILANQNATETGGYKLSMQGRRWVFSLHNGTEWVSATSTEDFTYGQWYHILISFYHNPNYGGGTVWMFVDGLPQGIVPAAYNANDTLSDITIGALVPEGQGAQQLFRGAIDEVRFYAKHFTILAALKLHEDGRYVRGYTDCKYPYLDCNPAVYSVPQAYEAMATNSVINAITAEDTDDYHYSLDANCSHLQGIQRFLPPNENWLVYSRSHTDGGYNAIGGISERVLGLVDMCPNPPDCTETPDVQGREKRFDYSIIYDGYYAPDEGHFDHAGGMQSIGEYLFVPMDTTCGTAIGTSTFYTAIYHLSDLTEDIDTINTPNVHLLADPAGVAKLGGAGDYEADVFVSVAKLADGKYLWLDAYYEDEDWELQTDLFRFNISYNSSLEEDPEFELVEPAPSVSHIDIDTSDYCMDYDGGTCSNGNWNSGTLVADTNGKLYLIMTNSTDISTILQVVIDKVNGSIMMYEPEDSQKNYYMGGLAGNATIFKAGAGGFVTENGVLSLFSSEYSNDDNDDIAYQWFNVN